MLIPSALFMDKQPVTEKRLSRCKVGSIVVAESIFFVQKQSVWGGHVVR